MEEELNAGGIEKACLKRLRETRLKSETVSTLIHILSRCYEDPEASRILSSAPTRPGGGSGEGDIVSDGVVVKDVADCEVKDLQRGDDDDDRRIEFSVDEIENIIMDVDVEGDIIDQETLQQVESSLMETVDVGDQVEESLASVNGFGTGVEVGFNGGEAVQCGSGDDKCLPSQSQKLDGMENVLECGYEQRANVSDVMEEGEIDNIDADVPLHVSMEDNIDIVQRIEAGADRVNDKEQRNGSGEVSCPDFSGSVFVGNADKDNGNYHRAFSDVCAETMTMTVKSLDAANIVSVVDINASVGAVSNNGLGCPIDSRRQIFYGDILEETLKSQSTLNADADHIKKRKRAGNKERKKIQKRKKRAEMDKKLGVKRMKLPQALKPKVVKVCEHYLKGRCLKGEECTFSHDATPLTKSKACIHFARNNCMKGDACPYDHELWKYPCDNYASKGFCNRGSNCLFSHEITAKEGSQVASNVEKIVLQATPIPATASKGPINSAVKSAASPPMKVPKGLTFLSIGKSSPDQLTQPDLSRSPQKVDLLRSNHSNHNATCMVKAIDAASIPLATPVTGNNDSVREAQSERFRNNKNSVSKVSSSKKIVDLTSPLDKALHGLNTLMSSKVPVSRFSNGCPPALSTKESNPPVSRLSGLSVHESLGSSADREKSGVNVAHRKGDISKSISQLVANMCEGAAQDKAPSDHYLSSEFSTVKPSQKLNTTIPKDWNFDKIFSIQDQGRLTVSGDPHTISAEETKSPASVNSPSSQGLAANKGMNISVENALLSTSRLASKFESETKVSHLGSAVNYQLQTKPESSIASSSKSSFNSEPVKASAILDFIFGTGSKLK